MMKLKQRLKTKRKGYIVFTCASLAFLAVFGVGFSSWIVVEEAKGGSANIYVADIITADLDFIVASPNDYQQGIEYNGTYGFVLNDTYGDACEMIASFYIEVAQARNAGYVVDEQIFLTCTTKCEADKNNVLKFITPANSSTEALMNISCGCRAASQPSTFDISISEIEYDLEANACNFVLPISFVGIYDGNYFVRFKYTFIFNGLTKPLVSGALVTKPSFSISLGAVL